MKQTEGYDRRGRFAAVKGCVVIQALLLLAPICAHAWTLNDRCELTKETPEGVAAVSRTAAGMLLQLPAGLVPNDTWVQVGIGSRTWRKRVVGGAVTLGNSAKAFREKNWLTVRSDNEQLLGFSLAGSMAGWTDLEACELDVSGGDWLVLTGEIDESTDDRIIATIRREHPRGLILNSPGGLVAEAQRIGSAVRDLGMETKVRANGQCLSACVFILAAGAPRTAETGARIGIHPSLVTRGLGSFADKQPSVADTTAYFAGMGVDGGRLAVLSTEVTSTNIRILTPEQLRSLRLVDNAPPVTRTRKGFVAATGRIGDNWWWILGLLGLLVISWELVRRRAG